MRKSLLLALALAFTLSCNVKDDGGAGETVKIGDQIWMAKNLDSNVSGSKCYGEDAFWNAPSQAEIQANCKKYGRLYPWATMMALDESCNSTSCASQIKAKHRGICPEGFHIPTNAEWDKLLRYADGDKGTESPYESKTAGKLLKAKSGWINYEEKPANGTDAFGFAALPGGYYYDPQDSNPFVGIGKSSKWWTASESSSELAHGRELASDYVSLFKFSEDGDNWYIGGHKYLAHSIRCVKD
jgi:uncharacterized protein (TIGR02145 family)